MVQDTITVKKFAVNDYVCKWLTSIKKVRTFRSENLRKFCVILVSI